MTFFWSFEAGICVRNFSFKWLKNNNKQFNCTRVYNHDNVCYLIFILCVGSEWVHRGFIRCFARSDNIATRGSTESGICPTLFERFQGLFLIFAQRRRLQTDIASTYFISWVDQCGCWSIPASTQHLYNIYTTSAQHLRRLSNIV